MVNVSSLPDAHVIDNAPQAALLRVLTDGTARAKVLAALLDTREFPAGHIGEQRYRDETNAVVRRRFEEVFTAEGLARLLGEPDETDNA